LAIWARQRGEVHPALQLLTYPMIDDRTVTRTDVDERHLRLWDQRSNRYGWTSYLGRQPGAPDVPGTAAASREPDLSGLPPAWIGVGTCDLFHDEDVAYAERLRQAGVPCELEVVPGAFHGFDGVAPRASITAHFREQQVRAFRKALMATAG
jgi:acetyl esterase/lipase